MSRRPPLAGDPNESALPPAACLAAILALSHDAISTETLEGTVLSWNAAAERLYGYRAAELVGTSSERLCPGDRAGERREVLSRLASGARVEHLATSRVRSDGEVIRVALTYAPIADEAGTLIGLVVVGGGLPPRPRSEASDETTDDSEGPYRALMEQAADAILVSDGRGYLIDANAAACQLTGYTRAELLRLHIEDTYPPEDLRLARERTAALARGERLFAERLLRRKDGGDVPVSISVRRLDDGRMQGIFHDLTERKRAEEAIRRSEEKFAKVFHSAPVAIAVSGMRDGVLLEVNGEFSRLLGYSREESIGRHTHALGLWVDPTLRDRIVTRLLAGDDVTDIELELRAKHGATLAVRGSMQALELDGEQYVLSAFIDVTESRVAREALHRSEAYYRSLIEQALDIITVINLDGTIRYSSPANQRILGYRPDEIRGRPVFDLVHPDDVAFAKQTFFAGIRKHGMVGSLEARFRHRDGSWRILAVVGRNLSDDPAVAGAIINAHDVTERRELEGQLLQAQKMEAVGRLAGGVAHDFNNLLTVISGFSDLLRSDLSPGHPGLVYVKEIQNAAERASGLTRQLLAFSRRQVLAPRVLDLNELVRNVEKMLVRLLGEDVDFEANLEEPLGAVRADPGQIEQVLMNLTVNSRDAMPEGGKLTISTRVATLCEVARLTDQTALAPGSYVTLSVADTGVGIDPEVQARVFEPFFTTKGPGKGTGLGLSTVYGIVHQSGGGIRVHSEPGRGATFTIYLPLVPDAPEAVAGDAVSAPSPAGTETVLLVEDDDSVRRIARELLRRQGYRVLEAADVPAARDVAARHPGVIHVLVTDLGLPGGSGRTLAMELVAERPRLRVIYMSGHAEAAGLPAGPAIARSRISRSRSPAVRWHGWSALPSMSLSRERASRERSDPISVSTVPLRERCAPWPLPWPGPGVPIAANQVGLPAEPGTCIVAFAQMSPEGLTLVIPAAVTQRMLRRVTLCT